MSVDPGKTLLSQIELGHIDPFLSLDCLKSSNLLQQALAFYVFTEEPRDSVMKELPHDTDIPTMLLGFLLNCVSADLTEAEIEKTGGYIYSKGEAFLELRVPLAEYWGKYARLLSEDRYFDRIADFLRATPNVYHSEIVTHALEAWAPRSQPFRKTMKEWKTDSVLSNYVSDLEDTINYSF